MREIVLALSVAACLIGLSSACGSSPTSPSSPLVGFRLAIQPTGATVTFQALLEGRTFTTSGTHSLQLAPGSYSLTGTFNPPGQLGTEGLFFTFLSDTASVGGVRAGSVVKVSGLAGAVASCMAAVHTGGTPSAAAQSFSLQFEVISSASGACP